VTVEPGDGAYALVATEHGSVVFRRNDRAEHQQPGIRWCPPSEAGLPCVSWQQLLNLGELLYTGQVRP
jgi:hypothetical protein